MIKPSIWNRWPHIVGGFSTRRFEPSDGNALSSFDMAANGQAEGRNLTPNRRRWLTEFRIDQDRLATGRQVHGTHVELADEPGVYDATDGLVSTTPGLALGIMVADCAAVLMADPVNNVIAAVHAGWRGASDGILDRAVQLMGQVGARSDQIRVYVSPCISTERFEVGEEVAGRFPSGYVDYEHYTKPHVDLKGFIAYRLQQCGVAGEHMEISPHCTYEDDERFYSYRRDRDASGRMMGMIALKR